MDINDFLHFSLLLASYSFKIWGLGANTFAILKPVRIKDQYRPWGAKDTAAVFFFEHRPRQRRPQTLLSEPLRRRRRRPSYMADGGGGGRAAYTHNMVVVVVGLLLHVRLLLTTLLRFLLGLFLLLHRRPTVEPSLSSPTTCSFSLTSPMCQPSISRREEELKKRVGSVETKNSSRPRLRRLQPPHHHHSQSDGDDGGGSCIGVISRGDQGEGEGGGEVGRRKVKSKGQLRLIKGTHSIVVWLRMAPPPSFGWRASLFWVCWLVSWFGRRSVWRCRKAFELEFNKKYIYFSPLDDPSSFIAS